MKKVSIIILLTALILGAFTACNGDVFSNLMTKSKRVITLEIPEGAGWEDATFDKSDTSVKTKELEIPEDCDTWADYLKKVTDIKVYVYGATTFTLMVKDGKVYFCFWYNSDYQAVFGLELNDSKSGLPPETVEASAGIVFEGTYTLTKYSPT